MRKALIALVGAILVLDLSYVYLRSGRTLPEPPLPAAPSVAELLARRETPAEAPQAALPPAPVRRPQGPCILRGWVRDRAGQRVAGVKVEAYPRNLASPGRLAPPTQTAGWTADSGPDGVFEFRDLPEGGYAVRALTEDRAALAALECTEAGPVPEAVLTLQPARRLPGRVRDPKGEPLTGAWVYVVGLGDPPQPAPLEALFPAYSGKQGVFVLGPAPAGPCRLAAVHPGYPPLLSDTLAADAPEAVLDLTQGVPVHGQVVYAGAGQPARRAGLRIADALLGLDLLGTMTADDGIFRVRGLNPGRYVLRLDGDRNRFAEGAPPAFDAAAAAGETPALLGPWRIALAGSIRGRIVNDADETGVGGVRVSLAGQPAPPVVSDPSGFYRFAPLATGAYTVSIARPAGWAIAGPAAQAVQLGEATQVEGPEFRLVRGATLAGVVLDAAGAPAPEANVYLSFAGGATRDAAVRCGADGVFVIAGLWRDAGVRVWAERLGRASRGSGPIEVGEAPVDGIVLTLAETAACRIAGRVVDAAGAGVGAARVHCTTPDPSMRVPLEAVADGEGRFAFEALLPGAYTLQAAAPGRGGRRSEPAPVEADAAAPRRVRLVLP